MSQTLIQPVRPMDSVLAFERPLTDGVLSVRVVLDEGSEIPRPLVTIGGEIVSTLGCPLPMRRTVTLNGRLVTHSIPTARDRIGVGLTDDEFAAYESVRDALLTRERESK